MSRIYERLLSRLRRRIANMINRAVITNVDTSGGLTLLQVKTKAGQLHDSIEYFELYGFTSTPLVGAEVLLLCLGGFRIAICANDRRYRKTDYAPGEVGLYTHEGDYIKLSQGRIIEVVAGAELTVTAPAVTINSDAVDVTCTGDATVSAAQIKLNGEVGRVVTTLHTCSLTGNPHPDGSSTVKAGL